MLFEFADFELDLQRFELRRAGAPVTLQRKVFDVIVYLVEHRERVIGKDELLVALWPGEHVNRTAVPWAMSRARKALGQGERGAAPIETVRGRGYRFVEPVRQRGPDSEPMRTSDFEETGGSQPTSSHDPFVGRSVEMGKLGAALDAARRHRRGGLWLGAGEPGAGKTRLALEVADRARTDGVSVWTGRCLEGGWTIPFWPWVQILRGCIKDSSFGDEAAALISELLERDGDANAAFRRRDYWLIERLFRFLVDAGRLSPRLIVLDDLHWADDASLELLALLCPELPRTSLLVIGMMDDTISRPIGSRPTPRLGPAEHIRLAPLEMAEVTRYATLVLGRTLPSDIARALFVSSGGNPLFLKDVVHQLDQAANQHSESLDVPKVPFSARKLMEGRLADLGVDACNVLQAASVVGETLQIGMLRRVTNWSLEELATRLDIAIGARVIVAGGAAGSYRFANGVLRQIIYEEIPSGRRAELHHLVTLALEADAELGVLVPADLAHHSYKALPYGDPARAEGYAGVAGQLAFSRGSFEEAVEFLEWALQALSMRADASPQRRCELLIALARSLRYSNRSAAARERVSEAVRLARTHGLPDLLLAAARCLRASFGTWSPPDDLACEAAQEARRQSCGRDTLLQAGALAQLARSFYDQSDVGKARWMADEAEALARKTGDPKVLLDALVARLTTLSGPADLSALLTTAREILAGRLLPGYEERAEAAIACVHAYSLKPNRESRDHWMRELASVARCLQREECSLVARRFAATIAFTEGQFDEAEHLFVCLEADERKVDSPGGTLYHTAYLLERARALTGFEHLLRVEPRLPSEWDWAAHQPVFRANRTALMLGAGLIAEAKFAFEALASADFANLVHDGSYLNTAACLSEVAIGVGDARRAELMYGILKPFDDYNTSSRFGFHRGPVALHLGQIALFLGWMKEAVEYLERSLAISSHMGWVPDVVRSQIALARAVEVDPRMKSRSRKLASAALNTAERLRMRPLIMEIAHLGLLGNPRQITKRPDYILVS